MSSHAAFFYGTLMAPGILYRVIYGHRDPEPWQKTLTTVRPAILEGYQRHKVRGAQYPGIIPCEGAMVRGSVCTGLTDGDIWRLDVFEGDEYDRVKVKAKILKDDIGLANKVPEDRLNESVIEEVDVDVYVFKESERHLLEKKEWDFEEFKAMNMKKWTGEERGSNGEGVDPYFEDRETNDDQAHKNGNLNGHSSNGMLVATVLDRSRGC